MELQLIVIIVALIILVGILIIVYLNLESKEQKFPRSMTNCPDYWEVNTDTGNCIIPSQDEPNANLGNLKDSGTPIYIYNFANQDGTNTIQMSTLPSSGGNTGTPYKINNYQVYAYNLNRDPAYYDIPVGYYTVPDNSIESRQTFLLDKIVEQGNEINFNDPAWMNYNGRGASVCQIKKWVNKHNIVWDGIDSYNQCI